jgi:molybdopterin/thiamine biosynthesis adenylyltransferase
VSEPALTAHSADLRYDRQVRAFGPQLQDDLARLTIAVVGVGGVGSLIVQGLAHLGASRLLLVDPDTVEPSNLNRLVGATPADAADGVGKVDVAARAFTATNPATAVHPVRGSVTEATAWSQLRAADVIVGAVDGHAARWALNRLAVQYARCYLDVGVDLRPADDRANARAGRRLEAGGHVAVVRPHGPCLLCLSGYDPAQVGVELDPALAAARRSAGYRADDPDAPTPSVLFLNQILAGHALAELVNLLTPWRPPLAYLLVDLVGSSTSVLAAERNDDCPACGPCSPRALSDAAGPPAFPATGTTLPRADSTPAI